MKNKKVSEQISEFNNFVKQAVKDKKWNEEEVHRLDLLTQDYLHELELDGLNYADRAKVATKLSKCRQERRKCKDIVELLTPIVDFAESEEGERAMNLLKNVLGQTRHLEDSRKNRTYKKKTEDTFNTR